MTEIDDNERLAREALGVVDTDNGDQENVVDLSGYNMDGKNKSPISQIPIEKIINERPTIGFVPITKDSLPSKGEFYDDDVVISVKSASNEEIKHYSSMNDDDPFEVDKHVISMINTCALISKGDNIKLSYRDLSEFDKVYAFFAIRDRTMLATKREHALYLNNECSACGHKNRKEVSNETFGYYKISKPFREAYSAKEKCFVFRDETFGKDPVKLYVPTVGVTEAITSYIREKETEKRDGEGGYYNISDINIIMFTTKDWRSFDKDNEYITERLKELKDSNKWNPDKYAFILEAIKRLKYGIKTAINYKCEACGGEINATVRFPSWRSLFTTDSAIRKFFEDSEQFDPE